jgi:hypothetical protein
LLELQLAATYPWLSPAISTPKAIVAFIALGVVGTINLRRSRRATNTPPADVGLDSEQQEPSMSGSARAAARAGSAVLILLTVLLAGLVVLGMATGTHRQFDKGETPLSIVISVQVLGVISLLTLGGVARACIGVWQGHRPRILGLIVLAISIWLFWAVLRIGEYAS